MDSQELFPKVVQVIATTFNADPSSISRDTIAEDVAGWDSLSHTILMVRLEKTLNVKIPENIASEAESVGDLTDLLAAIVN